MSELSMQNSNRPDVNDAWKEKFDIFQKIGADELTYNKALTSPEAKQLSFKERQKITWNTLAFVFGPLYYISKKLWAKGAVLYGAGLVLNSLLSLVEVFAGITLPLVVYWIPTAVLSAQLANYDYFRKIRHGENIWRGFPSFLSKPVGAIGFLVAALVLLVSVSALSPVPPEEAKAQTLADVSGVWRDDTGGELVTIALNEKWNVVTVLTIQEKKIPVKVQAIDLDNHVVSLGVALSDGQQVTWAVRQVFNREGRFTLQLTLHDGTQQALSFVRNLNPSDWESARSVSRSFE